LTPWLAALLVKPTFRRRGIGEQLIAAVAVKALQLGFTKIYVGTGKGSGTPESSLLNRGWTFVEKGSSFVSEISILHKALRQGASCSL
jgi:N-acetylglutamate synthase-like GNAT family acetyltransferase